MGFIFILIAIIVICVFLDNNYNKKKLEEKLAEEQEFYEDLEIECPRCGNKEYQVFITEEIVVPRKTKSTTSVNLNPLKPFTLYNHKEKVVRNEVKKQVSKFVCRKCGKIWE